MEARQSKCGDRQYRDKVQSNMEAGQSKCGDGQYRDKVQSNMEARQSNVGTDNTETRFKATWKLGSPMWGQTIQRQGSKQHGS